MHYKFMYYTSDFLDKRISTITDTIYNTFENKDKIKEILEND